MNVSDCINSIINDGVHFWHYMPKDAYFSTYDTMDIGWCECYVPNKGFYTDEIEVVSITDGYSKDVMTVDDFSNEFLRGNILIKKSDNERLECKEEVIDMLAKNVFVFSKYYVVHED